MKTANPMDDPALIAAAYVAVTSATTLEELRAAWEVQYLKVGHKRLGRILLGRDPTTGVKKA